MTKCKLIKKIFLIKNLIKYFCCREAKTFLEAVQTKIAQKREKLQSQRQQQRHTPAPVKQVFSK